MAIPYTPTANTKVLYHLDGNSTDSSGNGKNGTDANISYGTAYGYFDQGALFNGSNSKITIPQSAVLAGTGNFTMSVWYKGTAIAGPDQFVSIGNNSNNASYFLGRADTGGPYTEIYGGVTKKGTILINTGAFFNVIYSQTNGSVSVYVNGTLDFTQAYSPNLGTTYFILGNNSSTDWLTGSLDEFIYENTAWSQAQVTAYYNASAAVAAYPRVMIMS